MFMTSGRKPLLWCPVFQTSLILLSLFGLENDCISDCHSNISFIQNDLFICIHKHVNLLVQKIQPTLQEQKKTNKNFLPNPPPSLARIKTLVKMIGLVPRKAMRSIIQTDLMILLEKNNFCTSMERFEKVMGNTQEVSHHLHKLIYVIFKFYSWRRSLGNSWVFFFFSVK